MSGDAIHPAGPSQPNLEQVYETSGNPVSQQPAEKRTAQSNDQISKNAPAIDHRGPQDKGPSFDEATPTSVAYGVRGAGPGEEAVGKTHEQVGRNQELDAQQMAAPGEGRIASAVDEKPGATGVQPGFESDLDRKKAEQAPAREHIKEERKKDVDVGGVLGQRGGPANPVDQKGYPNASS